ncbi:MAG: serine hydrolase domain-containing protein [Acidimicrobiales bacterium]
MGALDRVAGWPVTTAAAGVVGPDGRRHLVGPVDLVLPWASVTKAVVALGFLVALEEGIVSLHEPAGPEGSTLAHLLAHASGLPLASRRPVAAPGARRIYSNAGFEILGEVLAGATAMTAADYLDEAVLSPLGMTGTTIEGSPASGAAGPLTDLVTFAHELMAPTLVAPAALARATGVAFPRLRGVLPGFGRQPANDWGLGFEVRDHKSPHWTGRANSPATFGHFGRSGSFVWVDPVAKVACAGVADRDFGPWAAVAWPDLADAVLAETGRRP